MTEVELLAVKATLLLVIVGVAYMGMLRRLSDTAHAYRLSMAELGEAMLSRDLPNESREQVTFYLDHAFSGWVALFAAFALPGAVVLGLYRDMRGYEQPRPSSDDRRMTALFAVSIFAANPVFGTILAAELFLLGLLLVMVRGRSALTAAIIALMKAERVIPAYRHRFA